MTYRQARVAYAKMNFKSSYGEVFGRKPNLTDLTDTEILKHQTFSQVPSLSVIKTKVQEYLDSWQKIEKDDHYISQVISTLRSLFKYIKNRVPPISVNRETHRKFLTNQLIKIERYDKMLTLRTKSVIKNKQDLKTLMIQSNIS